MAGERHYFFIYHKDYLNSPYGAAVEILPNDDTADVCENLCTKLKQAYPGKFDNLGSGYLLLWKTAYSGKFMPNDEAEFLHIEDCFTSTTNNRKTHGGTFREDFYKLATEPPAKMACNVWVRSNRKTIKWDEGIVDEVIEEGKFFTVSNVNLVTTSEVSTLRVYARKETCRVWSQFADLIKEPQKRRTRLLGCPGIGKKVLAWHFACHLVRKLSKQVVWFSLLSGSVFAKFVVFLLKAEGIEYAEFFSFDEIESILDNFDDDTIIFIDGVHPAILDSIRDIYQWWLSNPAEPAFVQLQAMQLDPPKNTVASLEIKRYWNEIYYHRWSINEFVEAITGDRELQKRVLPMLMPDNGLSADDSGISDEDLRTIIEKKSYYAGFSARYMFDMPIKEIEREIERAVTSLFESIKHPVTTIGHLLCFESMTLPRDKLFVKRKDEQSTFYYEPASAFVVARLCEKFSIRVLPMMRKYLETIDHENSPGMRGSVFEKYFGFVLQECLELKKGFVVLFDKRRTKEEWKVSNILKCPLKGSAVVGLEKWMPSRTDNNLWIDPVLPTNKGWNFAQYVQKESLFRAVQLTVAKEVKELEYEDVAKLIESLKGPGCKVEKCEYVYLHVDDGCDCPTILKNDQKAFKPADDGRFRSECGVQSRSRNGMLAWL